MPKNETSVPKTETTREKLADKDVNLVKNINPQKLSKSGLIIVGRKTRQPQPKQLYLKGGVQADSAGLVGLKNAKSFKK